MIHHDPDQLRLGVVDQVRRAGCTCTPKVEIDEIGVHGVYTASVSHDSRCRLLTKAVASCN